MLGISNSLKYAQIERERRFLLQQPPFDSNTALPYVDIVDTYLSGAQLRLRLMRDESGAAIAYKLTQKYHLPELPPHATVITNMYLSDEEYRLFAQLPGTTLRKRRYRFVEHGVPFAIDVFAGPLEGLILAEVECPTDAELAQIAVPWFAIHEVTSDPAFRGGHLAQLPAHVMRDAEPPSTPM